MRCVLENQQGRRVRGRTFKSSNVVQDLGLIALFEILGRVLLELDDRLLLAPRRWRHRCRRGWVGRHAVLVQVGLGGLRRSDRLGGRIGRRCSTLDRRSSTVGRRRSRFVVLRVRLDVVELERLELLAPLRQLLLALLELLLLVRQQLLEPDLRTVSGECRGRRRTVLARNLPISTFLACSASRSSASSPFFSSSSARASSTCDRIAFAAPLFSRICVSSSSISSTSSASAARLATSALSSLTWSFSPFSRLTSALVSMVCEVPICSRMLATLLRAILSCDASAIYIKRSLGRTGMPPIFSIEACRSDISPWICPTLCSSSSSS